MARNLKDKENYGELPVYVERFSSTFVLEKLALGFAGTAVVVPILVEGASYGSYSYFPLQVVNPRR